MMRGAQEPEKKEEQTNILSRPRMPMALPPAAAPASIAPAPEGDVPAASETGGQEQGTDG